MLKLKFYSKDICSGNLDIKMCPLCDRLCDYWELKNTCMHARITYLFDNTGTVIFAVFMSFWGNSTVYIIPFRY